VVSREISRNGGRHAYRAYEAQDRADLLTARPKPRKLEANTRLHDEVAKGLAADWSPRQISARLAEEHPHEAEMRVSHETIYETLYLQARGELRTQLKLALREGRTVRVPAGSTRPKQALRSAPVALLVSSAGDGGLDPFGCGGNMTPIVDLAVGEEEVHGTAMKIAVSHVGKASGTLATIKARLYANVLDALRDADNPLG